MKTPPVSLIVKNTSKKKPLPELATVFGFFL